MANFVDSPKFATFDDYYTTREIWEKVEHLLPKDKVIWEACMLNSDKSKSPEILQSFGCNMIWNCSWDILTESPECDFICTNIPFDTQIKKKILARLIELDKPFLIIMNSLNLYTKYMRTIFGDKLDDLQIITPLGKLQFEKLLDNGSTEVAGKCSFYSVFVAYKMNIPNSSLWLKHGKND
jgi:hypothetical protein